MLDVILKKAVIRKASDVHITAGIPVVFRINGMLEHQGETKLTAEDCENYAKKCIGEIQFKALNMFGEVDAVYTIYDFARFRVNLFKRCGTISIVFRIITLNIPQLSELGLPDIAYQLALKQRGLVLVTGPTGSGKSTTLAAMIDYINIKRKCHILTIEDPIEYVHSHKGCIVNQREIGNDTESYGKALRAALREDPDVILIGEMRDLETIAVALTAAETGHLVFSTLHTLGAAKTIDRIVDVFPPHQQAQVRNQLSTVLQGIITQQLIKNKDGLGQSVATEVMISTPAISNLIREAKTPQINSCIYNGGQQGMHIMDVSISKLLKTGKISYEAACQHAVDIENMSKLVV